MFKRFKNKIVFGIVLVGIVLAGWFFLGMRNSESTIILSLDSAENVSNLVDQMADNRYVLLGESSHGTAEYYRWRAEISKRLIKDHGFAFVVVEGDWPYVYQVNQYVKGIGGDFETGQQALLSQVRWPDWLWANEEFLEFIEWLRQYNQELPVNNRVGVYGLDMQNLAGAIESATAELLALEAGIFTQVNEHYDCLRRFESDFMIYAQAYGEDSSISCQNEVQQALNLFENTFGEEWLNSVNFFNIKQNMMAVEYGERYARSLVRGNTESWNERVRFMFKATLNLESFYEQSSVEPKGVIWAHNTHVGDARATEMSDVGMINIGQLMREHYDQENIFILGFSTYRGRVMAGREWGAQRQILTVPPPPEGSLDYYLGQFEQNLFALLFDDNSEYPFSESLGQRAKGVVYNPEQDSLANYVATVAAKRYDALIFIRTTTHLSPL